MTTHQPKSTHKSATILGHFLCNYPASSEGPSVLDFPGAGLKTKALAVGWVAGADYLKNPELGSAGASLQDTRAVFSRRGIPSRLLPLDLSLTPGAPQVSIPQPATALNQESFLQTWVISFPELKRPGTGALAGPRLRPLSLEMSASEKEKGETGRGRISQLCRLHEATALPNRRSKCRASRERLRFGTRQDAAPGAASRQAGSGGGRDRPTHARLRARRGGRRSAGPTPGVALELSRDAPPPPPSPC